MTEGLGAEASSVWRHLDLFRRLEAIAEERLASGHYDDAAAWAQIAADYAWRNHPGIFASPRLEAVLNAIGREALAPGEHRRPPNAPLGSILHVLTEAGPIGGHGRLARRWIEQDEQRSHSLVLTRQRETTLPEALAGAVRARGGDIAVLDERRRLVARARELRAIAAGFDLVVLHIHPFDVVPALALADDSSCPPVVLVNHADHVFWLGTGSADFVACIRQSGVRLAVERRGLGAATCSVLPIPLAPANRTLARAEAKRALGLPADAVLLLTVAQGQKYARVGRVDFLDLVTPVVEAHPQAVLFAVGPTPEGAWQDSGRRTGGRIRAIAATEDVCRFYEAADVYLDSYPFASLTALLEAGSFGAPVVSFRPHGPDAEVLAADDPALDDVLIAAASEAEYRAALSRLISYPGIRERTGARTRARIQEAHAGPGWAARLDELYARARRGGRATPGGAETVGEPTTLDTLLCRLHSASGWSIPLHEIVRSHVDCLSAPASTWAKILLARQLVRFFGAEERCHRLERRLFPSREAA